MSKETESGSSPAPARAPAPPLLLVLAFITVSIAWGTTYGGIKLAVATVPPFSMACIRFSIAGLVLMAVLRLVGIPFPTRRDWGRMAITGFLLLALGNALLGWAEQYVDSAFAALMVNTGPFMFVVLAALSGQRIPALAWGGLTVGFCGVALLVTPELRNLLTGRAVPVDENFWWAFAVLIASPLCWATGSFVGGRYPARCNNLMAAAGQSALGGGFAGLIALLLGEPATGWVPSRESLLAIAYLIVVGSWFGYVSYIYCLTHLPAHRVATIGYINNVTALTLGVVILGERLTPFMVAGGAVILSGVYLVNVARQKKIGSEEVEDGGKDDALDEEEPR